MYNIIGIDPGANKCAFALGDDGTLIACGSGTPQEILHRIPPFARIHFAVIEKPRIYPEISQKDKNDLIPVAIAAGECGGRLEALGCEVAYVEPKTWKGTFKKPVHHARVWKKMNDAERAIFANAVGYSISAINHKLRDAVDALALTGKATKYSWDAHNTFDAVGLLQWGTSVRENHFRKTRK